MWSGSCLVAEAVHHQRAGAAVPDRGGEPQRRAAAVEADAPGGQRPQVGGGAPPEERSRARSGGAPPGRATEAGWRLAACAELLAAALPHHEPHGAHGVRAGDPDRPGVRRRDPGRHVVAAGREAHGAPVVVLAGDRGGVPGLDAHHRPEGVRVVRAVVRVRRGGRRVGDHPLGVPAEAGVLPAPLDDLARAVAHDHLREAREAGAEVGDRTHREGAAVAAGGPRRDDLVAVRRAHGPDLERLADRCHHLDAEVGVDAAAVRVHDDLLGGPDADRRVDRSR